MTLTVSIVGMGPRGVSMLAALCEVVATARRRVSINVIGEGEPGAGVHRTDQPDYFITNTVAGDISAFDPASRCVNGPSLAEWLDIAPDRYVSRAVLGNYMCFAYRTIVEKLTASGAVVSEYGATAVSLVPAGKSACAVVLKDGRRICSSAVVVTTGHTGNLPSQEDRAREALVERHQGTNGRLRYFSSPLNWSALDDIAPDAAVGIEGLGLSSYDVVAHLTQGRGGQFDYLAYGDARYVPSGKEPQLTLFSRSGRLLRARGRRQKPLNQPHRPRYFTEHAISALRAQHGRLDFEHHVLPLLIRELQYAARRVGHFVSSADIQQLLFWENEHASGDIETFLQLDQDRASRGDIDDPFKRIADTLRDLRGLLREAVEFDGLSDASMQVFHDHFAPAINYLSGGGPWFRAAEWRALIDAGVLRVIAQPAECRATNSHADSFAITDRVHHHSIAQVDVLVRAMINRITPSTSNSPFLSALLEGGWATPYVMQDGRELGFLISRNGRLNCDHARVGVYALGPLTEGCHYFTNILGDPSGARLFDDARRVANDIHRTHQQGDSAIEQREYVG
ncbi:FAD-NAD(P)-binding [Carnimonas sp. R-84981]|uniref:FAD/NAD(P)-binding protein n=1 Tax=Carnimonas bestiolae TaxID=3402172 RepID=UPI003EDC2198